MVVTAAGDTGTDLNDLPYYPAVLTQKWDNVVSVTGTDERDELIQASSRKANTGAQSVLIAAPGSSIPVAEPRLGKARETSTGLAAALVAGALARYLGVDGEAH